MNIETWLKGRVVNGVDSEELVVPLSDFLSLLEDYAIVPRSASGRKCIIGGNIINETCGGDVMFTSLAAGKAYKAMIKAAEDE